MDAVDSSPGTSLGDFVDAARRHRWTLVVATALGLALASAYLAIVPREYVAVTSVLVQPTGAEETTVSGQRSNTEINLDTEAQLVTSTDIATIAADNLDGNDPVELAEHVRVSVPANTSILDISFAADRPELARDGARAFGAAYLTHRARAAQARLEQHIHGADTDLATLHTDRNKLSERLDDMSRSDPEYAEVKKSRDMLDTEIAEISANAGKWRTASESVGSGRIISEARTPDSSSSPHLVTVLGAGAMLGFLLGAAVVTLRRRFAVRLWTAADLPRRCGVGVLAALPSSTDVSSGEVFGPGPQSRVFGQVRNEVAAALDGSHGVVIVAGVAPGSTSSVVTANLAVAMARAGDTATAVATHTAGPITVTSQLDTPAVPGLCDVFADREELAAAKYRAARHPKLDVVGPGACATVAGPSRALMADVYKQLLEKTSYVVVDAAPMSVSAQAQLLACDAGAVILAVECGHDTARDVAEAAQAIRRVGGRLLGAVALPKLAGEHMELLEVPDTEATDDGDTRTAPRPRRGDRHRGDDTPTETLPRVGDGRVATTSTRSDDDN